MRRNMFYKDERDLLVRQLTPFIQLQPEFVEFENIQPELSLG